MQGKPAAPAGASDAAQAWGANLPRRILVVEDDASIRQVNTMMLTHFGYVVDGAENGAEAWQALNANRYDLLITDNNMPKVTGMELLQRVRTARMKMPVIMVTGAVPTEEFSRQPWLQPDAVLVKPYGFGDLLRTVKELLCEVDRLAGAAQQFPTNPSRRILVVDEDTQVRRLCAEVLAFPGCAVDVAEDGAAAWKALRATAYDLLITGHELSTLTGVELVRKLRAARMAVPVVMVAASLPTDELTRAPSLELAATLVKPFPAEALLDTVGKVLGVTGNLSKPASRPKRQGQPPSVGWLL